MTKYLSDDWMIENGFLNPSEEDELSLQWFALTFTFTFTFFKLTKIKNVSDQFKKLTDQFSRLIG